MAAESPTHNTGTKKPPGFRCRFTVGMAAQIARIIRNPSHNLPLTGHTLVTEGITSSTRDI